MNGTLLTADGRSVLRFERLLPHPPEKVWHAVTDVEELAAWFPARVEGERKAGAALRFLAGDAESEGEVLEYEPPRVFSFSWDVSVVRFELRPDPAGCLLVFTNTFDDRPFAASFATGWHRCLDVLALALDGRPAPPDSMGSDAQGRRWYRTRHEAYAEVFDLLRGAVVDGEVRFERLLPYPPDDVWAVLGADGTSGQDGATEESPEGTLRWELEPGPGGTHVKLCYPQPADELAALVAGHARLEELADALSGSQLGGTPAESLRALYGERA
jgi:uncharacterized protein YndB with AHSA1/START domain